MHGIYALMEMRAVKLERRQQYEALQEQQELANAPGDGAAGGHAARTAPLLQGAFARVLRRRWAGSGAVEVPLANER